MQFLSLQPFVPSGKNYEAAKSLFLELGFDIAWDAGDYAGFVKDACHFILQHYDNTAFAENFMVSVNVTSAKEFREMVLEKKLVEKYGIKLSEIIEQPYGKEVNIIDIAGVCWHFVE